MKIFFSLFLSTLVFKASSDLFPLESYKKEIKGCSFFGIKNYINILDPLDPDQPSIRKLFYFDQDQISDFKRILGANEDVNLLIFFPSAIWIPEKKAFLVIVRVTHHFYKSLLYASFFDSDWNQIKKKTSFLAVDLPGVLPISIPTKAEKCVGPEDPRIFIAPNREVLVIFNMNEIKYDRKQWIFSFSSGKIRKLTLGKHGVHFEKNWTPLIANNKLYILYNYKNLQIFDCGIENVNCDLVQGNFFHNPGSLRGGSPMVRFFDTDFYVSFAFTHLDHKVAKCASYRPSLTVIKAYNNNSDRFEHIYSSEPIDFDNRLFLEPISDIQSINNRCEQAHILVVTSIAKWDKETDEVDVLAYVNDKYDIVFKVKGLIDFVSKIIDSHENQKIKHKETCAHELAINYYA